MRTQLLPISVFLLCASLALPAISQAPQEEAERQIHPGQLLGLRQLQVASQIPLAKTLVIVESEDAFLRALSRWSLEARFPVLIDDGTWSAREDIARFVRAFGPEEILVYQPAPSGEPDMSTPAERADGIVANAWSAQEGESSQEAWSRLNFTPAGIVLASEADEARLAAIALAAGRGQLIAWTAAPSGGPSASLSNENLQRLRRVATDAADEAGLSWRGLGDAIDAVTVCMSMPSRMTREKQVYAMTDAIGRSNDFDRYAYAGHLFGNAAESVYMAMCSLFIDLDSAFLFDGYAGSNFGDYALDSLDELARSQGWSTLFSRSGDADRERWRLLARRGIDEAFVQINTSGHARWFEVDQPKERLFTSDLPAFSRPAFVHFTHSFSAQMMGARETIGRRLLDNGAFAYYGSCDEPYLSAFLPAHIMLRRLLGSMALGAAVRIDNAKVWKLNLFGDPLYTLQPKERPAAEMPSLDETTSLRARMSTRLRAKDIASATRDLVMLGREEEALKLVRAVSDDEEQEITPELAVDTIFAAYRSGDEQLVADLYERLPEEIANDPLHASMLWQVLRSELRGEASEQVVRLLARHIPPSARVDNATAIRRHVLRELGENERDAMFVRLIREAANDRERQQLRDLAGFSR